LSSIWEQKCTIAKRILTKCDRDGDKEFYADLTKMTLLSLDKLNKSFDAKETQKLKAFGKGVP